MTPPARPRARRRGVAVEGQRTVAGRSSPRATARCGTERIPVRLTALVPARDGAVHDIRAFDHVRDPQRAAGLLAALDQVRADAAVGLRLGFALLGGWQRHVLAVPHTHFRSRPAFAKAGRERYGTGPDVRRRFDACLAQSRDPALDPAARAARTYLDVCFFPPFADGNGRSAFLALVFVLARAGIVLDQVGPIRRAQRHADDADDAGGALALADLVAVPIRHTRRRGTTGIAGPAGPAIPAGR